MISSKYADGAFDLVAEGENGYIVDPEDTHAFAEKIDQIFADETVLRRWERAATSARMHLHEEVAKGCIDALCYVMGKGCQMKNIVQRTWKPRMDRRFVLLKKYHIQLSGE